MNFGQTCIATSPMYALPVICERLLHCRLIVAITWYDLHKISDTQSILMYHPVLKAKNLQALVFQIQL